MSGPTIDDLAAKLAGTTVEATTELVYKRKDSTFKLNTAEDAKELVSSIDNFDNLKALRLEGNTMGIEAAEAVGKALQKHPEFERALWSDMFTGRLKTEIPHALKHLGAGIMVAGARLVELDLSDNAFGPNGMNGLVDLLPNVSCFALNILKLNNNGLGITGGKMLAKCLTECFENSKSAGRPLALKVFISGRNRLENDGTKALAQVFKMIGTLENISMPQNGINPPGILALADALSTNPNITTLNLNDNTVTEKGALSLAEVLPKLTNLEVLNFGDCLLRNGGAMKIAEVLQNNNPKLKELILSGNEIRQEGGNAIIEAIENKQHIIKLDLDANQFGEDGCEVIKGMLEAMNKEDILGSLSDDEGSDEDEDDDDDEYEDVEDEEQDSEEGEEVNDPVLQVKGQGIKPEKTEVKNASPTVSVPKSSSEMSPVRTGAPDVTASEFLASPTPSKLLGLGDNKTEAIKAELGSESNDIEKVVDTVFKISSIVTESDDKTKTTACQCADELLKPVVRDESGSSVFTNLFLVKLGLIKGEDKKYRPPEDISGPLLVLTHIIQQEYIARFSREMLQVFISKPHPVFEKAHTAQHQLLQTLYAF